MAGKTKISVCAADRLSLLVDAIVDEQDTSLLLGKEPVIHETQEIYPDLVRKMVQQKPLAQGQLLIKNTVPLRITAIVYDIEKTPVCSEETIAVVLGHLLEKFDEYRLKSVAMPLLGYAHGKFRVARFVTLLQIALNKRTPDYPAEILLITHPDEVEDVYDIFKHLQ